MRTPNNRIKKKTRFPMSMESGFFCLDNYYMLYYV